MKTKIVYVLVLREKKYYYEMFLLSVYSLRLHNPGCEITVVLDRKSWHAVSAMRGEVFDGINLLAVDIPSDYLGYDSRYLKTQLRRFITGDYLYLDTDTVIAGSLSEIDDVRAIVAAIPDGNGPVGLWKQSEVFLCRKAGVETPEGKPYYNGGVLFVKDAPDAYALYEAWHSQWRSMLARGVGRDQMSLLVANQQQGNLIRELPGIWNCQICSNVAIPYFHKAKIIHYYSNIEHFVERFIISHVNSSNGLDKEARELAANPRRYGYNFYRQKKVAPTSFIWSELLHLCRTHRDIFLFLKSLSIGATGQGKNRNSLNERN
ncbi:MAG: hypothetical protein IKN06_10940 [Bacteroidales bacterium]|nr:hypothetical protein [Bacteroidales bacterium]